MTISHIISFLLLLLSVDCIEKNVLLSLSENDFWPNDLISSPNGENLELYTGVPYAIQKCDGSLIMDVVLLPTIYANQYFMKEKNGSQWLGRWNDTDEINGEIDYYWGKWLGKEFVKILTVDSKLNNRYFWTFDKGSSGLFTITSSLYTYEVGANCGSKINVCSNPKKVDDGFVARYYYWCNPGYVRTYGFTFKPLFENPLAIEASIYNIKYESNLEDLIKNYTKQQVTLLESTIPNNNLAEIDQLVSNSTTLNEKFCYDFYDVWSNFHTVGVDASLYNTAGSSFFGLFSDEIKASISAGYKYEHNQTTSYEMKSETTKSETYSIYRRVKVPPHDNMKVFWYVNFIENMPVKVKLQFKITSTTLRENLKNELKEVHLDSVLVEKILKQRGYNSRIKIIGQEKDYLIGELDGIITASFGVDTKSDVKSVGGTSDSIFHETIPRFN